MAPPSATQEGANPSPQPHPLLRGGRPPFPHDFTADQMEALEALCSTFVPSIAVSNEDPEVAEFYELSAATVAPMVAGRMTRFLQPKQLSIVKQVLSQLSGPKDTKKFSDLPLEEREKLLYCWANSDDESRRIIFKTFKGFILHTFYTKVDSSGWNPAWKGIGYSGPDAESMKAKLSPKPLKDAVLDAREATNLLSVLQQAGYAAMDESEVENIKQCHNADELKQLEENDTISVKCDAVIVGAGCGGGVVAAVLAKAGYKVLVLEKGRYFAREDLSLLEAPTFEELYESGGFLGTSNGAYSLIAGSTVGGGTCVNWSASFRTPPHVIRQWSGELGLPMFGTDVYQKALDAVCKRLGVQSEVHVESFQNSILRKGCQELGYHIANIPRNTAPDHFCGCCGFACRQGLKQATSETWLVDAAAAGMKILTGVKADKVLLHSSASSGKPNRAVGVLATLLDTDNKPTAKKLLIHSRITVLASGSILTPPLLLRSGLQNPNIGKHLHIHPVTGTWGYFPDEKAGAAGSAAEGGIMTAFSSECGNWDTTGYGALLMTPGFHPGQHAAALTWKCGRQHKELMRRYRRTSGVAVLVRDRGEGSVGLDEDGELKIEYGALHPEDEAAALEAGEKALRVLRAAGAVELGTHHHDAESFVVGTSETAAAEDERFEEYLSRVRAKRIQLNRVPLLGYHLQGSCRMGPAPHCSAVDPTGETWEVEDLFLGDASILPSPTGVNPMISIQSVAYCTAHNVLTKLTGV